LPYGISDAVWKFLDFQTQQMIIDSYGEQPDYPTGESILELSPIFADPTGQGDPANWPPGYDPYPISTTPSGVGMGGGGPSIGDIVYPQGPSGPAYRFTGTGWVVVGTTGGGGGGRRGFVEELGITANQSPTNATFSPYDHTIAGAPEWWRALAPDIINPVSEYQTLSNLLIPFLSPEDQRTVSTNLFQSDPKQFSFYDPELLEGLTPAREITPQIRHEYFTGDRANRALQSFDDLLKISGRKPEDFGPGYNYLRGLADTFRDIELTSGATQLTETQQSELFSKLDPLIAQSQQGGARELQAYGPISRSFVNPFFSAGALTGQVRNQFNQLVNAPNPRYR